MQVSFKGNAASYPDNLKGRSVTLDPQKLSDFQNFNPGLVGDTFTVRTDTRLLRVADTKGHEHAIYADYFDVVPPLCE